MSSILYSIRNTVVGRVITLAGTTPDKMRVVAVVLSGQRRLEWGNKPYNIGRETAQSGKVGMHTEILAYVHLRP